MVVSYSQNKASNKEELRLAYYDFPPNLETWGDLQPLMNLVGGCDGEKIAPLEGQVYSSFCDVISVNFEEVATHIRKLVNSNRSKKCLPVTKNELLYEQIFKYLFNIHPLLADPLDIRTAVLKIENEKFDSSKTKSQNTAPVIFKKFLMVCLYIEALMNGDIRLNDKNVWLRFSSRYLLSQMPLQIPVVPDILDYDGKAFISEEKELEITFELFLRSLEDESMLGDSYYCDDVFQFITGSVYSLLDRGLTIKRCSNCGKHFVPLSRSDTIYCDRVSPQDKKRSCKEYGSQKLWYDRLKTDTAAKLSRNIYMAKQMLVKRNPDISGYKDMFEYFKRERKKWEMDIKAGTKSREEYIDWLNEMKGKRVL